MTTITTSTNMPSFHRPDSRRNIGLFRRFRTRGGCSVSCLCWKGLNTVLCHNPHDEGGLKQWETCLQS